MKKNKEQKDKEQEKKKVRLGRLFYNNKFVLILSVCLAFGLWLVMAFTNTEKYPHTINNVPVKLDLSAEAQANNLKVFSPKDLKVMVKVTGNSLIVNSLKAEDITVTPQGLQNIVTSGTNDLLLTAQTSADLQIQIVPDRVRLYVDYAAEKNFELDSDYSQNGIQYTIMDGFFLSKPTFSTESVTVTGPRSEVSRIAKVTASCNAGELGSSKQLTSQKIVMLDSSGQEIKSQYLTISQDTVDVSFNVQPLRELPLQAEFTGQPSGLILTSSMLTIQPDTILVAAPLESFQNRDSIHLKPKSFSSILPQNGVYMFDAEVDLPSGFTNINTVTKATVILKFDGYTTKVLEVKNFKANNLAVDYEASITSTSIPVTIVGPQSELDTITEENLVGVVDLSSKKDFTGSASMPVAISISGAQKSWVYGDDYVVNVTVKKNT